MKTLSGLIFDVKKYAIHDGPGIRTTVFFKGCPLRCAWCHNPEGQSARPEVMVKATRCLAGCRACAAACPKGAIIRRGRSLSVDRSSCDGCGVCADTCPSQALELAGRKTSVPELAERLFQDNVFYERSGGGVTFSGGEPLSQPDFLEALLAECRRREVRTAIDTCGYVPAEVLGRFAGKADLFLYDLKVMDEARHTRWTGVSNRTILENLRVLAGAGQRIVIRIPLVSGINDDPDNVRRTADFVRSLKSVERISLLPYHNLARDKFGRLEREDGDHEFAAPSAERVEQARTEFEAQGFRVSLGD